MSSTASKRSAQRRAAQGPLGKLKKENEQLRAQLGETRMAVLNMRQMYRQVEQELMGAQQRAANADTLTAVVLLLLAGKEAVSVSDTALEHLQAEYAYVDTSPGEEGTTLVRLVPKEEAEALAEEVEEDGAGESEEE